MFLDDLKNELQDFNNNDFFLGLTLKEKNYNKNYSPAESSNIFNVETSLEKYKKSILILKELGIANFRFSLSWEAILPEGIGFVDQTKIAFYHEVLDYCISNEIEPFVTLFDFNLPLPIEKKGGWLNREIVDWFENYVLICINAFKTKVNYWIVINQSSVFTKSNFFTNKQTLNEKWLNDFLPFLHHTLLCQSVGYKTIKKISQDTQVGSVFPCHFIKPKSFSDKDLKAAERIDAIVNRVFLEPSLGFGYPIKMAPCLKKISKYFLKGDDELLKVDFDFIGLQNFKPEIVEHDLYIPFINARVINQNKNESDLGSSEFENNSDLFYRIIRKYTNYEEIKKIIFFENNSSLLEEMILLHDNQSIKPIQIITFMQQIIKAKNNGGKVDGYFISLNSHTLD